MQLRLLMTGVGAGLLVGVIWFSAASQNGGGIVQQASAQIPKVVEQKPTQQTPAALPQQSPNEPSDTGLIESIRTEWKTFVGDFVRFDLPSLGITSDSFERSLGLQFDKSASNGGFVMSTAVTPGLVIVKLTGKYNEIYSTLFLLSNAGDQDSTELAVKRLIKVATLATPKWSELELATWIERFLQEDNGTAVTPDYYLEFKKIPLVSGGFAMIGGIRGVSAPNVAKPIRRLPLSATDSHDLFEVTIHRVLTGEECVLAGVEYASRHKEAEKAGKRLIYFDVSVKRVEKGRWRVQKDEHSVSWVDFKLVDNSDLTYSCNSPNDAIRGNIHKGRSTRGGIIFSVYQENVPTELLFNSRITDSQSGKPLAVHFDSLQNLER